MTLIAMLIALAHTSGATAGTPTAAESGARPAASAASSSTSTPARGVAANPGAPDLKRGQRLYLQCRACHALGTDQEGKVGPALGGVIGRKAAAVPGFAYSKALASSNLTWDEQTLDRWLAQPSALVPGTSMAFAGLSQAEDRRQLVAYLQYATASR